LVVLLLVGVLYPAVWALVAWLVWHLDTGAGHVSIVAAVELVLFGGLACLVAAHPICGLLRWLVRRWTGVTVADGYRPAVSIVRMSTGYWWNGRRYWRFRALARVNRWVHRQLRDPAAWRERRALVLVVFVVVGVTAIPVTSAVAGVVLIGSRAFPLGVEFLVIPFAFGASPFVWRGAMSALTQLLRPSPATALSRRVAQLTEQRADATAAQAAEIRRIERDLHDGAQARLIALGMTLTTAERAIDRDPAQAKALLGEARVTITTALRELRELVRGISPPVLSERGLTDALRALALDTPLPVSVHADPGFDTGLDVPIESALYFGTAELLTNVVKHADASRVTIRLCRHRDAVVIEVTDDGRGDATPSATGGLAGLRRRLAVFDGTLSVVSPPCGPTHVRMVVPWTSS
jgi:signal transduction histidine kinase